MIHQPTLPQRQTLVLQGQSYEFAGYVFHLEYFSSFFFLMPMHSFFFNLFIFFY